MKSRLVSITLGVAALLVALPGAALAAEVSHSDFKIFLETRDALQDERVVKMPEAKRIPAIARRNFDMSGAKLQAILDRVEAAGGEKGIAEQARKDIEAALAGTDLKDRIKEVKVDTSSPHVVTYIKWVGTEGKVDEEASLIALKAGSASHVTSTYYLWAVDGKGQDLWRAKIGADRTHHIKEDRIKDWATTRYVKLFEVESLPN